MVKKTVTDKKRRANQANGRKSTGPQSAWGKRISSLNATSSGLFSTQLVNPRCDGEDAEKQFARLLNGLQLQFEPDNIMEQWLVEKMADSMWRLRRATLAERGSSFLSVWGGSLVTAENSPMRQVLICLTEEQRVLAILDAASTEIQQTGTLTKESHAVVVPLIDKPKEPKKSESKEPNESTPSIDGDFTGRLEAKRFALRSSLASLHNKMKKAAEHLELKCSLPPAEDMEKILRYEKRMYKQLEWAWQTLLGVQDAKSSKQ